MMPVMSISTRRAVKIAGTGSFLPERVLTNLDMEKLVETSDAWIQERTGIARRHIAAGEERNTDMAKKAAEAALSSAGLSAQDIDTIIFATVTPDQIMPSAACTLQAKLGCRPIMAFDLSAACSGFVYALSVADSMIATGQCTNVLVVGAEKLSGIVDFTDRETCILFGDGAGAVVLTPAAAGDRNAFHAFHSRSNGNLGDLLYLDSGRPQDGLARVESGAIPYVHMKGREIFKSAVRAMADCAQTVLQAHGKSAEDVDWFIPHQANIRIIQAVGDLLGMPSEKTIVNIQDTGNTSSATIPIAFDQAVRDGRIRRGQTVLFGAFGAGLTSGAALFTF